METMSSLTKAGVPQASVRLMRIILQAETQAAGSWQVKRKCLYGYFFQDYLGLGLPTEGCGYGQRRTLKGHGVLWLHRNLPIEIFV